jgi:hypothetical protein
MYMTHTNPYEPWAEVGAHRDRISRVDYYERKGIFMNPWLALYGEKRGKLAKVGEWQHVPVDRETVWTRQSSNKDQ